MAKDHNILDYGAQSGGEKLNTTAIQKAIDKAHEEGGGRVIIPKGVFLSGSIVIKSNVELHLKRKAVLLGSAHPDDYIQLHRWKALVMADSAINISISGKGTIDGQGCKLALHIDSLYYAGKIPERRYTHKEKRPVPDIRPQIIEFWQCKNIVVSGITVQNGASWVQTYDLCENLLIDGIKVHSTAYWNNDGIDVIDSKNVTITNCYVNSADDGICIKSMKHPYGMTGICDGITIRNCVVRSSASAVKLGTSSYTGFKNVLIENIKVFDTYRSAIALEIYEGGILENAVVRNIKAVNTGNAIFIRLGKKDYENRPTGTLKNVTIKNVKVKIAKGRPDEGYPLKGPALPFFHNVFPSSITGIPGHPVENVVLENIKIIYPGGGNPCYANMPVSRLEQVPEQIEAYPEFSMFGELPAWGFYVRHVDGLVMKNIKIRVRKKDYRPAMVFDDVSDLQMDRVMSSGDPKENDLIFNNVGKRVHTAPDF